jgi:serine/threonine-protein kinase
MLVGKPPFVSDGFGELVNMHLNVPPQSPRAGRPDLSDAMDALVLKMLAKSPEDRFPDMTALQGALKVAGGTQLSLGSSPDILNAPTKPRDTVEPDPRMSVSVGGTIAQSHTTFTSNVGEREPIPEPRRGRGKLVAGVLAAAVALGGGALWLSRGGLGGGNASGPGPTPVATETPAPPVKTAPPTAPQAPTTVPTTPTPPTPIAPAKITVRLASTPVGVRVLGAASGELLGTTPVALSRPRGGTLKVRFEKDGYTPLARELTLDEDQELDVTLEKKPSKPAKTSHHPREAEPAKL